METLLNWVWQGTLTALALNLFLKACGPRLAAGRRFRLWWLALVAILVAPALTMWVGRLGNSAIAMSDAGAPVPLPHAAQASTPLVILLWILFSVAAVVRLGLDVVRVNRAKRSCSPFPADRERSLRHWNSVRYATGPRLMVSADVGSAAVLGICSPVIAVHPRLVSALNDDELDQIILHEWAHVERHDPGLNAIERLVLAVFALHPAISWVGRQLRLEREAACDDRVVSIAGSTKRYAACLLKLGALTVPHVDLLTAPAALTTSQLAARIHRLLDVRRQSLTSRWRLAGSLGAGVVVLTAATVANIELVGAAEPLISPVATMMLTTADESTPRGLDAALALAPDRRPSQSGPTQPAGANRARTRIQANGAVHGNSPSTNTPVVESNSHVLSAAGPAIGAPAHSHADSPIGRLEVEPLRRFDLSRNVTLSSEIQPGTASEKPRTPTPWGAAADSGVAVGRGSQKAAVATAGFLKRVSKSVAGAFVPGDPNELRK